MRLTVYTDYTLRVMIYLVVKHREDQLATIDEIAKAYDISRNHLTKIVSELATHGFVETRKGRGGGVRLARRPEQISVGEIVRMAEKDFSIVVCQDLHQEHGCAVFQACNLKRGMRRAVDAFMHELDRMTMADAVAAPSVAAALLQLTAPAPAVVRMPETRSGRGAPPARRPSTIAAPARAPRPRQR